MSKKYRLHEGGLEYQWKNAWLRIVTSEKDQENIIKLFHEGGESITSKAMAGHRGRNNTLDLISKKYIWKGMEAQIREYVVTCDTCQRVNSNSVNIRSEMTPVTIPKYPMKQIGVDIKTLPETEDGYKYFVLAVDYFTKYVEARALKDKSADSVARFIFEDIICRYSCTVNIQINDQGREFVSSISDKLHSLIGVKQRVTSAYHPQANGLTERNNRTIGERLVKCLLQDNNIKRWP